MCNRKVAKKAFAFSIITSKKRNREWDLDLRSLLTLKPTGVVTQEHLI
jgi:hypothetical protein